jgi:hypothetical protein
MSFEDKDLFAPINSRDLRKDHPELLSYDEFAKDKIESKELLFVYYYCSFFSNLTGRKRIVDAFHKAFGVAAAEKDRVKYYDGNYPPNVRLTIARWEKFSVPARIMAKITVEKMFENIQNMVDVNISTDFVDKEGEINFQKKKAYVDTCSTIIDVLPKLIDMEERGFGITENATAKEERKAGNSYLSKFHQLEEENK